MSRRLFFLALLFLVLASVSAAPNATSNITSTTTVETNQLFTISFNITAAGGDTITQIDIYYAGFYNGTHPLLGSVSCGSTGGTWNPWIGDTGGSHYVVRCNTTGSGTGTTGSEIIAFAVPATATAGAYSFSDIRVYNSSGASALSASPYPAMNVINQAVITATVAQDLPTLVSRGQQVTVKFNVANAAGGADATSVTGYNSSSQTVTWGTASPSGSQTIGQGTSVNWSYPITIPSNAPLGALAVYFNASGTSQTSGRTISTTQVSTSTTVQTPPTLNISAFYSSQSFLSNVEANRTSVISVTLQNLGAATATLAGATITPQIIHSASGAVDNNFVITRTDSVTTIASGVSANLTFNVTAMAATTEGQKRFNLTITNYADTNCVSTCLYSAGPTQSAVLFTIDQSPPTVTFTAPSSGSWARQGESVSVNATISDPLSGSATPAGIPNGTCTVSVGGVSAGTVSYTWVNSTLGYCAGSITIPTSTNLYDSSPILITKADNVGNSGSNSRDINIYTLRVSLTSTGASPDNITDGNVTVVPYSGGSTIQCTRITGTSLNNSHYCPVPPDTYVNITANAPAYLRATDNNVQVGPWPATFITRALQLQPNTRIIIRDQFGNSIPNANITIFGTQGGSLAIYSLRIQDGDSSDKNSTSGVIDLAIPIGSTWDNPFYIWVGHYEEQVGGVKVTNPGYMNWNTTVTLSTTSLNQITSSNNFTVLFRTFDEWSNQITQSNGAAVTYDYNSLACQHNGTTNYWGCAVPTQADVPALVNGRNITASFNDPASYAYVSYVIGPIIPPATPALSQSQVTNQSSNKFTVLLTPQNEFNTNIYSYVSNVTWGSLACSANGTVWGCPIPAGQTLWSRALQSTTAPNGGYLDWSTNPGVSLSAQTSVNSSNQFTVKIQTKNEFGEDLTGTNITSVTFNYGGGVSCVQNSSTSTWGCPVPNSTASNYIDVGPSGAASTHYISYRIPNHTVPTLKTDSQTTNNSLNNYTVLVVTKNEFSSTLADTTGNVTFSSTSCRNNSTNPQNWHCPVPLNAGSVSVLVQKSGYLNFTNSSVSPPAFNGNRVVVTSANKFPILVTAQSEAIPPAILLNASSVIFNSLTCLPNAALSPTYSWGCNLTGTQFPGNVTVVAPGFVNWSSYPTYGNLDNSSLILNNQLLVTSANNYTLKVSLYDELGAALSSVSLNSTNLEYPSSCQPTAGGSTKYCPVAAGTAPTLTASKSGYITRTNSTAVPTTNATAQSFYNFTGIQYTTALTVWDQSGTAPLSSSITFTVNGTPTTPSAQSGSQNNTYYFSLTSGSYPATLEKVGYALKSITLNPNEASGSTPTGGSVTMNYAIQVVAQSENGTALSAGTGLSFAVDGSPTTPPYITSNSYYFNLTNGLHTISVSRAGYVNTTNSTLANSSTTQNTTYLILPYTLRVNALDWGAASLNLTTVNVYYTNGTLFSSESMGTKTVTYYQLDPATFPSGLYVSMNRSGYETNTSATITLSSGSQSALAASSAINIRLNLTDWSGAPVNDADIYLLTSASTIIAQLHSGSSGLYTFTANQSAASSSTDSQFNRGELNNTQNITLRVTKGSSIGYGNQTTNPVQYSYQNLTAPFDLGLARVGANIRVNVTQSWSPGTPVTGAVVSLLNGSATGIASKLLEASDNGIVVFSADAAASLSGTDSSFSQAELAESGTYTLLIAKPGYSISSSVGGTYSSAPITAPHHHNVALVDNAPPTITITSPASLSNLYGSVDLTVALADADQTPGDGITDTVGVNYSSANFIFLNSTGGSLLSPYNAFASLNCTTSPCTKSSIPTLDLPIANLTLLVNVSDSLGNWNWTNVSISSQPFLTVQALSGGKTSAYANGTSPANADFLRQPFRLVVKGNYSKLGLSDLVNGSNVFPIVGWAFVNYVNSTGSSKNFTVANSAPLSQTPDTFQNQNLSLVYSRQQDVNLTLFVPANIVAGSYNGTYQWIAYG